MAYGNWPTSLRRTWRSLIRVTGAVRGMTAVGVAAAAVLDVVDVAAAVRAGDVAGFVVVVVVVVAGAGFAVVVDEVLAEPAAVAVVLVVPAVSVGVGAGVPPVASSARAAGAPTVRATTAR